jgi:hypothetical protein
MRAKKAEKYNELKDKKNTEEYEAWFLRYRPTDSKNINENEKTDKKITRRKTNKKRKTKKRKGFFF